MIGFAKASDPKVETTFGIQSGAFSFDKSIVGRAPKGRTMLSGSAE
jgi:hypothetical protein